MFNSLSLSLSLSVNSGYGQNTPIYNQVGEWCDTYTQTNPGPGSSECIECLNHPQQLMQNANASKTKNRVLYVDDFASFRRRSTGEVLDPKTGGDWYYFPDSLSILGNLDREKKLLEYACAAGFDELVLYSIPSVLKRGADYFEDNPNNLTWAEELGRFMLIAHQLYGLDISINAPESTRGLANVQDFYDLTALGNNRKTYLDAFINNGNASCGNWGIIGGGSLGGGYFDRSDIELVYPVDSEDNLHPFDQAVLDIFNVGRFKYNIERGFSEGFLWERINEKMMEEDNPWLNLDGTYTGCINGNAYTTLLFQEICHSYERIVTEYEFWNDASNVLFENSTDKIYDIEAAFVEQTLLLDYIECINVNLQDYWNEIGYSCPVAADAYIISLTSASRFANGQLGAPQRKHYVNASSWQAPFNNITTYNHDSTSRAMAKVLDNKADRIYLATYRKTPCHLWSDDVENNNQSYGRRFKDVYSYFSDNLAGSLNGETEIYPLFSARHYVFDHDFDTSDVDSYRRHLGLYLSNSGIYAGVNGFTGSLGGAEQIFNWFAHNPIVGCNSGDLRPTSTYPIPDYLIAAPSIVSNSNSTTIYTGTVVLMLNLVKDKIYSLSTSNSTDEFTITEGSATGPVVVYKKGGNVKFKPRNNGNYFLQLNRGNNGNTCTYHSDTTGYSRNFEITLEPLGVLESVDANPYIATHYDNQMNGYAWYRYSELGGRWHSQPGWQLFKTDSPTSVVKSLREDEDLKIYPIPSSNELVNIIQEGNFEVLIYNLKGELLNQVKGEDHVQLNQLQPGQYVLQVLTSNGIRAKKIIVQ